MNRQRSSTRRFYLEEEIMGLVKSNESDRGCKTKQTNTRPTSNTNVKQMSKMSAEKAKMREKKMLRDHRQVTLISFPVGIHVN